MNKIKCGVQWGGVLYMVIPNSEMRTPHCPRCVLYILLCSVYICIVFHAHCLIHNAGGHKQTQVCYAREVYKTACVDRPENSGL